MGNKKRKAYMECAEYQNHVAFTQYYRRLTELSLSMFEWTGLPETVDPRYLELALFKNGSAVFFLDEAIGHLALKCAANGKLNVYDVPMIRRAYASNGYNNTLTYKNSVIIYNNYLRTNSVTDVEMFSKRLADLDRAIEVNANAQKTPILIQCDENQRLTMENLYRQYDGNTPVIFGVKGLDELGTLKVMTTGAPYVADRLYTLKTQIWNEALTYLGISNTNIQKKERLISDEVIRSQGGTIASRYSRLESRRQACEQINDMFGLNIWCNYRQDYREADDELMFSGSSGDGNVDTLAIDVRTN